MLPSQMRVPTPLPSPSAYVLVNHATGLDDASVAEVAAAMTQDDKATFSVWWGKPATPTVASRTISAGQWPIYLLDHSDQEGALGYHDLTSRVPFSRVFLADCKADGVNWTVDADHERKEMDVDPFINLCSDTGQGTIVGWEVGDPVQDDSEGYVVGGVTLSDFVTPAWFIPQLGGPVDAHGKLTKPFTLAPGGYASINKGGRWTQITRRTYMLGSIASRITTARAADENGVSVRAQRAHRAMQRAGSKHIEQIVIDSESILDAF